MQTLSVRIETGDERTADDLARKERALERHHDEIAPRFIDRVAHAHNRGAGFAIESGRGANDKIVVGRPGQNVAGIRRFERDRAGFEIDAIHVEGVAIAQIERDEDEVADAADRSKHFARERRGTASDRERFCSPDWRKKDDRFRRRRCPEDRECVCHRRSIRTTESGDEFRS